MTQLLASLRSLRGGSYWGCECKQLRSPWRCLALQELPSGEFLSNSSNCLVRKHLMFLGCVIIFAVHFVILSMCRQIAEDVFFIWLCFTFFSCGLLSHLTTWQQLHLFPVIVVSGNNHSTCSSSELIHTDTTHEMFSVVFYFSLGAIYKCNPTQTHYVLHTWTWNNHSLVLHPLREHDSSSPVRLQPINTLATKVSSPQARQPSSQTQLSSSRMIMNPCTVATYGALQY